MGWIQRLQQRWNLGSTRQVWLVLLVFALTGTTVYLIKQPILGLLGIARGETWWMTILYLLVVFPLYLLLLLFYAAILGQLKFFKAYVGKQGKRKAGLSVKKGKSPATMIKYDRACFSQGRTLTLWHDAVGLLLYPGEHPALWQSLRKTVPESSAV